MAVIKNAFTVFRNRFRMAMASEEGMGVVEVILIIVAIFTHDKRVYKTCIW